MFPLKIEELESWGSTKVCSICEEKSNHKYKSFRQVRHHSDFTGKYRGVAQSIYSLRFNKPTDVPIILHNGCTYEFYLVLKHLS